MSIVNVCTELLPVSLRFNFFQDVAIITALLLQT